MLAIGFLWPRLIPKDGETVDVSYRKLLASQLQLIRRFIVLRCACASQGFSLQHLRLSGRACLCIWQALLGSMDQPKLVRLVLLDWLVLSRRSLWASWLIVLDHFG